MIRSRSATLLLSVALATLGFARLAPAQLVGYSGAVTLFGGPVENGFVIAGTFAPSFDPFSYKYVYGDEVGNMLTSEYSQAVADGAFRPIGGGTTTSADGSFAATGFSTAGAGRPVYLFAFDNANPDLAGSFALATDASWITDGSLLSIAAADASVFVFGGKFGSTIGLNGLPMPEPAASTLIAALFAVVAPRMRRRSRRATALLSHG